MELLWWLLKKKGIPEHVAIKQGENQLPEAQTLPSCNYLFKKTITNSRFIQLLGLNHDRGGASIAGCRGSKNALYLFVNLCLLLGQEDVP